MKPRFFRLARKIALTSDSKFRVGAVLIKGNSIMGMGCNDMTKSHPLMTEYSSGTRKPLIKVHAELAACRGWTPKEVDNRFSLYIFRVRKDGSQGLAKPCDTCFRIIQEAGVSRIYFSMDDEGYGDLKLEQNSR
jgi:deoxycytidylate deaminase